MPIRKLVANKIRERSVGNTIQSLKSLRMQLPQWKGVILNACIHSGKKHFNNIIAWVLDQSILKV